jgi:hypothetical protein
VTEAKTVLNRFRDSLMSPLSAAATTMPIDTNKRKAAEVHIEGAVEASALDLSLASHDRHLMRLGMPLSDAQSHACSGSTGTSTETENLAMR